MAPHFLVDENLSPCLVEPARRRGFEAMHVNYPAHGNGLGSAEGAQHNGRRSITLNRERGP